MDSTPPSPPIPSSNPPIQANPISSIPSSQKLPIKRKNPNSNSTLILTIPNLQSTNDDEIDAAGTDHDAVARNPPFKFHRIWSEPDEIRLLQGLLDCSLQGLSFPRDLGIFYAQFSTGMSQPYSKSQLSEKLRRLRKKFRVISSRLSKGLDKSQLSPQDRALYDLSKQLWEPDQPSIPFAGANSNCETVDNNNCKSNSAGVRVNFTPTLPSSSTAVLALPSVIKKTDSRDNGEKINKIDGSGGGLKDDFNGNVNVELGGDVKLVANEVKVKNFGDDLSNGIVHFATTALADVVDRSLKEMKMMIDVKRFSNVEKDMSFEKRWRDQYVAEFDVLAKRLKLILEHSMVSK